MKALKYITVAAALLLPMTACDSFLEVTPQGIANSDDLNSVDNVEKMVIAAYSALGNDNYQDGMFSPWPYGDLRAGDAYKGGAGTGDMGDFHLFETFVYLRDDNSYLDKRWYAQYINIARCNDALKRINALSESDYAKKKMREAEVRFLRAHFYFEIKIMFKHIPWVDENDQSEDYINISNVEYTDQQLWEMISEEFRYAVNNLPETQD